jgi:hypothetical protein
MFLASAVGYAVLSNPVFLMMTRGTFGTGNHLAPVFYLIACALVGGVASLFNKARHGQALDETVDLNVGP